jgi:hypothetical protein
LLPQENYLANDLLHSLANKDLSPATDTTKPWIFLLLSFLFEHQENYDDPLEIVEELYADFNYPEEISSLVRYMPPPKESKDPKDGYLKIGKQHYQFMKTLSNNRTDPFSIKGTGLLSTYS